MIVFNLALWKDRGFWLLGGMVDTTDLKSVAPCERAGSSPAEATTLEN